MTSLFTVRSGCDSGVSKSTVSRIFRDIDTEVAAFRTRSLDHLAMAYVYLDATYVKARHRHRIVSCAVVVATAVTAEGNRGVLGVEIGDSEDEAQGRHRPHVPGRLAAGMHGRHQRSPRRDHRMHRESPSPRHGTDHQTPRSMCIQRVAAILIQRVAHQLLGDTITQEASFHRT